MEKGHNSVTRFGEIFATLAHRHKTLAILKGFI